MSKAETLPEPKLCKCGHKVMWFVPLGPDDPKPDWYEPDWRMKSDVVERPCPHRNGTMIEYCPACDRQVGMWGCGPAGGMECDCWDARPWWRRLLDRLT
ncbi:hypothetical protein EUA02_29865 [Mycobacterium paragordonae]|uniref:hypothetical protein n=1 Tax=Mycobacterium paragordonae TaxID=1389713 RepID=UPI001060B208|nr:hypothetical protein [Mycobacterium paragordonae]TDK85468.1 hypothetical protein EUA02_29865 [Mycobacterium paragordonae]TDK98960.1 hypothetical protein EUA05_31120 [Mycobacterium paragordonae]